MFFNKILNAAVCNFSNTSSCMAWIKINLAFVSGINNKKKVFVLMVNSSIANKLLISFGHFNISLDYFNKAELKYDHFFVQLSSKVQPNIASSQHWRLVWAIDFPLIMNCSFDSVWRPRVMLSIFLFLAVIAFFVMARSKRARQGTYSPGRQEMSGSRVEMGNVLKPPPEERLIWRV